MDVDIGVAAAQRTQRPGEIARGETLVRYRSQNVGGRNGPRDGPSRWWTVGFSTATTQERKDSSVDPPLREVNVGNDGRRGQTRVAQSIGERVVAEGRREGAS